MRIGLVSQWYDPEVGSAAQSGIIARSLVDLGHDVEVITGWPNYPTGRLYAGFEPSIYKVERMRGVTVHRSPLYPSHDRNAARRALNYLTFATSGTAVALTKLRGVDVCLVHGTPATAALPAMALKLAQGVPFVVHIHDLWPDSVVSSGFLSPSASQLVRVPLDWFCRQVYRTASAIAVTSPGMAPKVIRRGARTGETHFVPNWADENIFRPTSPDQALRRELGLDGRFVVMYAGNLGEYQDLATMIDAADVVQHRRDIVFVIVGDGVERRRLEEKVCSLGLRNVRFVGSRPYAEMPAYLGMADVQLVSLLDLELFRTTLPSKLMSVMASGRPILGALTGDAAQLVLDSGAGVVVAPGRALDLASAVERLSGLSRTQLEGMARAGLTYYQRHLAKDVASRRLEALLKEATVRHRRSK